MIIYDFMNARHYKLIACNIFMREICAAISESVHVIDPDFTELGEHIHSESLRDAIQARINAASSGSRAYDAILLAYGLCGNATVGLTARNIPLVIPRAHDCCTLLLGSRRAFARHFGDNPSRPFSSAGYMDRGDYYMRRDEQGTHIHYGDGYDDLVAQYGEDNAAYIWETMHPPALLQIEQQAVFIEMPETARLKHSQRFKAQTASEGKTCRILTGNPRLLRGLLQADWPPDEYLVVAPGYRTNGRYDAETVIDSRPA